MWAASGLRQQLKTAIFHNRRHMAAGLQPLDRGLQGCSGQETMVPIEVRQTDGDRARVLPLHV